MPSPTYTPLANITLGSSVATVTFSSIPTSGYRDLVLICGNMNSNTSSPASVFVQQINGSDVGTQSNVSMSGNGSSASSSSDTQLRIGFPAVGYNNVSEANIIANFMDYSATDKHKTILSRSNGAGIEASASALRWASTSAITSFRLSNGGGHSFAPATTFALYGIAS